jgi:hypothetical protein
MIKKLCGIIPQTNYTDRATAAGINLIGIK